MEIQTRCVFGTRESPRFVSKEFYEATKRRIELFQFDFTLMPSTIRYYLPPAFVIGNNTDFDSFEIEVDDQCLTPHCLRRAFLERKVYTFQQPNHRLDKISTVTEHVRDDYFLCLPNAVYFNSNVFTDWMVSHLLMDGETWDVHFRQVFVDPHDTRETIWFHSSPRYQIEVRTFQDFRNRETQLKDSLSLLLP